MDTFGDVDFRALAVVVWLIIAAGTLRVMLVPTVLVLRCSPGQVEKSGLGSLLGFRRSGGTFPQLCMAPA